MPKRISMADMARSFELQATALKLAPELAALASAPILEAAAQGVFGHAPPLQDLAESTQTERVRLGFTANDPLVRTGRLRATVEAVAAGPVVAVGSSDQIAVYQEFGTAHIPPRPAIRIGFYAVQPEVKKEFESAIGLAVKAASAV